MIVHDGTFNPVFVRRGKLPALVEPAGGDVVERVAIRVLEFGNFRVVNVPTDEEKVVSLCFFDQLDEALLLVRVVCPGFVAVVFDAELRATWQ